MTTGELISILILAGFMFLCTPWGGLTLWACVKGFFRGLSAICFFAIGVAIVNSPGIYHQFGQTPFGYLADMPNYDTLVPGDPDPMVPGQYIPGAPHNKVPEKYYTYNWWKRPAHQQPETGGISAPRQTRYTRQ